LNAACFQAATKPSSALRVIEHTLQELPPHVRNAFYRHRVDGYAQNVIARDIGVSKASVCAYIHLADQSCRKALQNAELVRPA
jgi:RNA polymerase sigma-70 factor (ECF subfamily)